MEKELLHDCRELMESQPNMTSGVYEIQPNGSEVPVQVKCHSDGWTVIQSRGQYGNPVDYFRRSWKPYVDGFGVAGKMNL